MDTYECTYKYCRHDSRAIAREDVYVKGKKHMHKDCARDSENIVRVKDAFTDCVKGAVSYPRLTKAILDIVYKSNVDSEYLAFAMEYALKNKYEIWSPQYLQYLIQRREIKEAWKNRLLQDSVEVQHSTTQKKVEKALEENKFAFTKESNCGFESIFGG
jgi:hypothetical protein